MMKSYKINLQAGLRIRNDIDQVRIRIQRNLKTGSDRIRNPAYRTVICRYFTIKFLPQNKSDYGTKIQVRQIICDGTQ